MVGAHPFGGFNMSGTDSKAGGQDYLLLFLQAKSIAENLRREVDHPKEGANLCVLCASAVNARHSSLR